MISKDTKAVAYLILKGQELLRMGKDDVGDSEFHFEDSPELEQLMREFPLTPFKRYIDIYKTIIKSIKE